MVIRRWVMAGSQTCVGIPLQTSESTDLDGVASFNGVPDDKSTVVVSRLSSSNRQSLLEAASCLARESATDVWCD